jgi:hypothetical protein
MYGPRESIYVGVARLFSTGLGHNDFQAIFFGCSNDKAHIQYRRMELTAGVSYVVPWAAEVLVKRPTGPSSRVPLGQARGRCGAVLRPVHAQTDGHCAAQWAQLDFLFVDIYPHGFTIPFIQIFI